MPSSTESHSRSTSGAVAQRGRAHAVRAEPHEVVEVEQQVVRADLHRHRRGPRASRPRTSSALHRARDVHDLDPHAGVRRQVERAMHRLLLDERRPRLVVGERIAPPCGAHARESRLQQRVALGVHEHEAADGRDHRACPSRNSASVTCGYDGSETGMKALKPIAPSRPLAGDLGDRRARSARPRARSRRRPCRAPSRASRGRAPRRRDGRIGERVLDHRRDAAGGGRHRAGREVLALGVPGILEVRVHVDRARHHDAARRRRSARRPGRPRRARRAPRCGRPRSRRRPRTRPSRSPPCRRRSPSASRSRDHSYPSIRRGAACRPAPRSHARHPRDR